MCAHTTSYATDARIAKVVVYAHMVEIGKAAVIAKGLKYAYT